MNEHPNQLESRLAQLRPRALSPALENAVASELIAAPRFSYGDRFFWSAVAIGALAACVIIGVLLDQPSPAPNSLPALLGRPSGHHSLTTLARADGRWGDELKLASDWSLP